MAPLLITWQIGKRLTGTWNARNDFGKTYEDDLNRSPIPPWSVFEPCALPNQ